MCAGVVPLPGAAGGGAGGGPAGEGSAGRHRLEPWQEYVIHLTGGAAVLGGGAVVMLDCLAEGLACVVVYNYSWEMDCEFFVCA